MKMDQSNESFLLPEWTLCPYQKLETIQHFIKRFYFGTDTIQTTTYTFTFKLFVTSSICQCWKEITSKSLGAFSFGKSRFKININILNCDSPINDWDPVTDLLVISCILSGPGDEPPSDDLLELTPDCHQAALAVIEVLAVPHAGVVEVPVEPDSLSRVDVVFATRVIANTNMIKDESAGLVHNSRAQNVRANSIQVREKVIKAVIGCQSPGGGQRPTLDRAAGRPAQSTQSQAGPDITKNDSPARLGPRESPAVTGHGLDDATCSQTGRQTDTWDPDQPETRSQADKNSTERGGPSILQVSGQPQRQGNHCKNSGEGEVVSRPMLGMICALLRDPQILGRDPRSL